MNVNKYQAFTPFLIITYFCTNHNGNHFLNEYLDEQMSAEDVSSF